MSLSQKHWYFAYGSNMSASVLSASRGIQPFETAAMRIEDLSLCFNVAGIPYSEPAMGGLRALDPLRDPCCVHGVGLLLTDRDLQRLVASEGGGIAYRVKTLDASVISTGTVVQVCTLVPRRPVRRSRERLPSKRYLLLLLQGAKESRLPAPYIQMLAELPCFHPQSSVMWRSGRWCFLSTWLPISRYIQAGVRKYKDSSGHVPEWFIHCFDVLLSFMWLQHDYVYSWICGRGDGLDYSH